MPELTAVRVVVRGRVQGVGFRFATCRQADRLGVAGWVRNLPTGEVGVFAQGPPAPVEALVEWLRQGPRGARVAGIEVTVAEVDPELGSFDLRY